MRSDVAPRVKLWDVRLSGKMHAVILATPLDRVLERGRFIHLDGPSGRTHHLNLEEILPAGTDRRARISGTHTN